MTEYRIEDAGQLAQVVQGRVDPAKPTLFSTMRNEMGFLPAFLAHYRGMGFAQFLIFDDASDDGTSQFLAAQADCVVMRSELKFGDEIWYRDPDGDLRRERAGTYFKIALPHLFFDGQYVAYVDADEFLILPPGVTDIAQVIDRLTMQGAPSAVASVVEFFPADVAALRGPMPDSFDGLIGTYPYYQPERLVIPCIGAQPEIVGKSKTERLFKRFEVKPKVVRKGLERLWMSSKRRKGQMFQKSPRHKTPLVRRDAGSRLTGSHYANLPPSSDVVLCIAHFVFTSQFSDKIARVQDWQGHANGGAKYRYYAELLDKMQGVTDGFLDATSVRYRGPEALLECGLMRW